MNQKTINTLSQLIDSIERIRSYYPSQIMNDNPVTTLFLYRGVCDHSFKLLPSVYRKVTDDVDGHLITNDKYLVWRDEKSLLLSFIHEASGILNIPTDDLFRWAEYAQHYGVPTRFLDWSSNPFVALYFACKDANKKDGCVWLLHQQNYHRFFTKTISSPSSDKTIKQIVTNSFNEKEEIDYPVLYTPYYVDARMSAQCSYFLVWGAKKDPLEDMLTDKSLLIDLPENDEGYRTYGKPQETNVLFQFIIPADRKQPLLRELDMVGINEKTLFPGLDGIGRYVEKKHRFDYNEAISR